MEGQSDMFEGVTGFEVEITLAARVIANFEQDRQPYLKATFWLRSYQQSLVRVWMTSSDTGSKLEGSVSLLVPQLERPEMGVDVIRRSPWPEFEFFSSCEGIVIELIQDEEKQAYSVYARIPAISDLQSLCEMLDYVAQWFARLLDGFKVTVDPSHWGQPKFKLLFGEKRELPISHVGRLERMAWRDQTANK